MKYILVTAHEQMIFEDSVNSMLGRGWQLQGGVSISIDVDDNPNFAQAMVKMTGKRNEVLQIAEQEMNPN